VARFARIYPLHFFTLILAIVLFVPKWGWEAFDDPKGIVYNLLLIHAMGFQKTLTWNFPSWSICGEWWSYMIFPFVAIFLYRRKQLAIATLVILVFISYMGILYWIPRVDIHNPSLPAPHNMDTSFDFGYLRGMTGFVTGMLTYKLYRAGILTRVFSMDITAIAVITASLLYLQLGTNDGICIIFFALIVFTFAQSNNFLHRICNNRLAQYLGNISYSIYLVQFFPLFPLFALPINLPGVNYPKDATPITGFWVGAGYCLLYIFILIGVSSLTYYYIEKPCRKYINARWGKQRMPVYA
jgi:peptidoglycan/LPS O-acetylase OafA/YrhL